jgi:hypothetical protein
MENFSITSWDIEQGVVEADQEALLTSITGKRKPYKYVIGRHSRLVQFYLLLRMRSESSDLDTQFNREPFISILNIENYFASIEEPKIFGDDVQVHLNGTRSPGVDIIKETHAHFAGLLDTQCEPIAAMDDGRLVHQISKATSSYWATNSRIGLLLRRTEHFGGKYGPTLLESFAGLTRARSSDMLFKLATKGIMKMRDFRAENDLLLVQHPLAGKADADVLQSAFFLLPLLIGLRRAEIGRLNSPSNVLFPTPPKKKFFRTKSVHFKDGLKASIKMVSPGAMLRQLDLATKHIVNISEPEKC